MIILDLKELEEGTNNVTFSFSFFQYIYTVDLILFYWCELVQHVMNEKFHYFENSLIFGILNK